MHMQIILLLYMFPGKYYYIAEIVCVGIQVVFNKCNTADKVCSSMKWLKSAKQLTMYNKTAVEVYKIYCDSTFYKKKLFCL